VNPLFISYRPVTIVQRKRWLHERIEAMGPETLAGLFPALERMLEGGHHD